MGCKPQETNNLCLFAGDLQVIYAGEIGGVAENNYTLCGSPLPREAPHIFVPSTPKETLRFNGTKKVYSLDLFLYENNYRKLKQRKESSLSLSRSDHPHKRGQIRIYGIAHLPRTPTTTRLGDPIHATSHFSHKGKRT